MIRSFLCMPPVSEADFSISETTKIYPRNSFEMAESDFIKVKEMCCEICEELTAELKKEEVLHVDTKSVTKCETFSTKATVSEHVEVSKLTVLMAKIRTTSIALFQFDASLGANALCLRFSAGNHDEWDHDRQHRYWRTSVQLQANGSWRYYLEGQWRVCN